MSIEARSWAISGALYLTCGLIVYAVWTLTIGQVSAWAILVWPIPFVVLVVVIAAMAMILLIFKTFVAAALTASKPPTQSESPTATRH